MSRQAIQDVNDGKPWSEMDLFDLRNSLAYGRSIEEVAIRVLGRKIKSGLHDAIALEEQKSDTNNNGRPARRRSTLQY
jgi:hypothetical protein